MASDFYDPDPSNASIAQPDYSGQTPMNGFGGLGAYNLNGQQYFGSNGDLNQYQIGAPMDRDYLNTLGYNGDPLQQDSQEHNVTSLQQTPEFQKWLQDSGTQFGQKYTPHTQGLAGLWTTRAFDKNNNVFGGSFNSPDDTGINSPFDYATRTLASAMGGYAGGAVAGSYGAGTMATQAAAGAGAGALSGGASAAEPGNPGSIARGAATGAIGGGIAGANPAGYAGITDPQYSRYFNNAVGSGVKAGINGGNPLTAMASSGLNSGVSMGLQTGATKMFGDNSTAYNNEDYEPGGYQAPDNSSSSMGGGGALQSLFPGQSTNPAFTAQNQDPYGMMSGQGNGGGYSPDMGNNVNFGVNTGQGQQQRTAATNPLMDGIKKALGYGTQQFGSNMDNMAGNLMQLYQSNKNQRQLGGLAGNLNSLYGQNSPYANQLRQTLLRSDAAAGRRSQVGTREVELQARLAQLNSQNAPELAKLYGGQQNNQGQMLQSLLRMGGPSLANLFKNQGASQGGYVPSNSPYNANYENQMDQGLAGPN